MRPTIKPYLAGGTSQGSPVQGTPVTPMSSGGGGIYNPDAGGRPNGGQGGGGIYNPDAGGRPNGGQGGGIFNPNAGGRPNGGQPRGFRADGITENEMETIKQGFHRADGLDKNESAGALDKKPDGTPLKKEELLKKVLFLHKSGDVAWKKAASLLKSKYPNYFKVHKKHLISKGIKFKNAAGVSANEIATIKKGFHRADGITDAAIEAVEIGFHRASGANFLGADGDSDMMIKEELLDSHAIDNSNFLAASGKKKKKKKKAGRILAAIFTGGASELINKQAKDTKKIVQKAAAKRAAKGKKPILKGKLGDKIRAKMLAKKKADALKKAKTIKAISGKTKFKNTPLKTGIAKNIYNDRVLKNELLQTQGAAPISLSLPPSINEQKEAVTQYVYDNPQQAPQQLVDYSYQYPEVQQAIPQPQEAAHYGAQQEVMQYYEENIEQQSPDYAEEVNDTEAMPEEYIEQQDEVAADEDGGEESGEESSGEDEGTYEGFDSQISTGINSDALNISRYDTVYQSFDGGFFGADGVDVNEDAETEVASEYYGITEEEKAAKRAAKAKQKADKQAAKDAKKTSKPQTDKGKKTAAALAGIGTAVLAAAPAVIDSIKGNSSGAKTTLGDDLSGADAGAGEADGGKEGETILIVSAILIGIGALYYIGSRFLIPSNKGK